MRTCILASFAIVFCIVTSDASVLPLPLGAEELRQMEVSGELSPEQKNILTTAYDGYLRKYLVLLDGPVSQLSERLIDTKAPGDQESDKSFASLESKVIDQVVLLDADLFSNILAVATDEQATRLNSVRATYQSRRYLSSFGLQQLLPGGKLADLEIVCASSNLIESENEIVLVRLQAYRDGFNNKVHNLWRMYRARGKATGDGHAANVLRDEMLRLVKFNNESFCSLFASLSDRSKRRLVVEYFLRAFPPSSIHDYNYLGEALEYMSEYAGATVKEQVKSLLAQYDNKYFTISVAIVKEMSNSLNGEGGERLPGYLEERTQLNRWADQRLRAAANSSELSAALRRQQARFLSQTGANESYTSRSGIESRPKEVGTSAPQGYSASRARFLMDIRAVDLVAEAFDLDQNVKEMLRQLVADANGMMNTVSSRIYEFEARLKNDRPAASEKENGTVTSDNIARTLDELRALMDKVAAAESSFVLKCNEVCGRELGEVVLAAMGNRSLSENPCSLYSLVQKSEHAINWAAMLGDESVLMISIGVDLLKERAVEMNATAKEHRAKGIQLLGTMRAYLKSTEAIHTASEVVHARHNYDVARAEFAGVHATLQNINREVHRRLVERLDDRDRMKVIREYRLLAYPSIFREVKYLDDRLQACLRTGAIRGSSFDDIRKLAGEDGGQNEVVYLKLMGIVDQLDDMDFLDATGAHRRMSLEAMFQIIKEYLKCIELLTKRKCVGRLDDVEASCLFD